MKLCLYITIVLFACSAVFADTTRRSSNDPCVAARSSTTPASTSTSSSRRVCGNNGVIFADRNAFECAKKTNSRLRRISCNDSLILAKNALSNIRQQNSEGTLQVSNDRVRRLRERHEQMQRDRNQQS